MRRLAIRILLPLALASVAPVAPAAEPAKAPPPPYVVRVLALGHEPERKFKSITGGLFVMLPPEPDEVPPSALYLRPPGPPAPLPPNSPLARQFDRVPCGITLNGIQQSILPAEIPRDAKLVIEREALVQPTANGAGPVAKVYDELGSLELKPGASSALVILYNPVGSKVWNNVKANVMDTSESVLPPGSVWVYNLCREKLVATIGTPGAGTLAPGQSAMVQPKTDADGNFALRLLLERGDAVVQLIDGERSFPPGSRGFLVVYPVPENRNARAADFILFVIPPDPKPEPLAAPGGNGPAGAKGGARAGAR